MSISDGIKTCNWPQVNKIFVSIPEKCLWRVSLDPQREARRVLPAPVLPRAARPQPPQPQGCGLAQGDHVLLAGSWS